MRKNLILTFLFILSIIFSTNVLSFEERFYVVDAGRNFDDFYVLTRVYTFPVDSNENLFRWYQSYGAQRIEPDLLCFKLTEGFRDTNGYCYSPFEQRTMMWNRNELDLKNDFLLDLELQFSDSTEIGRICGSNHDSTCKGGMGIAFVMIPEADDNDLRTYVGSPGRFLGAIPYDTVNGIYSKYSSNMPEHYIVLEFDTFCNEANYDDLPGLSIEPKPGAEKVDHIALVNTKYLHHYPPSNPKHEKIDTSHKDVKASSDIYCVRIKWENINSKYKLSVYVKNKSTQNMYKERYSYEFDSLGQVMQPLSRYNSKVNWGIAAGAETERYSSTQRVIFKNLIKDEQYGGVYINKHIPCSFLLYLVNVDNTKQFLYPTLDDCCGYQLRHFENSTQVCINEIKEIVVGRTQDIESYGIKIDWYDDNDSLLESNNNVFNLQEYKKSITYLLPYFVLRAHIEKEFNNQGNLDTVRDDLYFHIYLTNNYFAINDTNCTNIGNNVYCFSANSSKLDTILLSPNIGSCNYEIIDVDSNKYDTIPYLNNRELCFRLKENLDTCETEFGIRRVCDGCADSVRIKLNIYNNNISSNDIRIIKSCFGPKIQINESTCSDSLLNYKLKFNNGTSIPIIDNYLPIDTNNYEEECWLEIYDKYTNAKLDSIYFSNLVGYDDLFPFYQESPTITKLDRSGEQEDICNYVVSCKLLSSLDTLKYEITSEIYGNRTTLYTNSNLEILDTIQVQCIDGSPIEYILNISCKADRLFPSIDVCTDTLILMCSCNGCDYCDAFDDKIHINIARDSAGVLIDLGNKNGYGTRGRYCKFRVNIDDYLGCDNSGSRILLQSPNNGHGEWLFPINLDSLVYQVAGSNGLGGELYEYVQDTIRISYITPQGDTCYKEQPVYCECYAGVDLEIRPNAYPELPTVCSYTVKEMETGGITFLLKDIQGSVVQILGQLDANSSPVGDIPINTTLLPSGVYFVTAEKNGIVVSYNPVQFIKQ